MANVRVKLFAETASGNRKGWFKVVKSVDQTKTDGYAFVGDWLESGVETDLPVGSVVIEKEPCGSVKHPYSMGACYVIDEGGKAFPPALGETHRFRWPEDFLSFRDYVAQVLAAGVNPPAEQPAENPLATYSDDMLIAELERRGIHVTRVASA